ncbi:MAG TPA: Rieske (2Fe-2S) protein [Rhodospirillales bacterium]|nr:Rieske (2Fe-2S) protein [Rhodospirillales bacterium]HIL75235.1 Rieske (2Fe-2S) protein [Rhodospirillales bacterium]
MAGQSLNDSLVRWPSKSLTDIPYDLFTSKAQYELEKEAIFKGPAWHYLCLRVEVLNPGDYVVSHIGETSIIVVRNEQKIIKAMVNRCAHRGAMLCQKRRGTTRKFSCVYHAWSYDLDGNLTNVAFSKGIKNQGGMPGDFKNEDYPLRRLKITEFCGLVFGSFDENVPDIETYLGPDVSAKVKRVLNRPVKVIGRNTQVLPNNWKIYMENVKDSYHASILHLFFTTFRLNRLTQSGGIIVDESGGNHVSFSVLDKDMSNKAYEEDDVRSDNSKVKLADPNLLEGVDEFGDGITLQILTIFPGFVLQQVRNSLAVRQVLPKGTDRSDLVWTYIGFEDDDEEMDARRLRQANLVGPAGYISMEDGVVGGFVQRAIRGVTEDHSIVKMGGEEANSMESRVTESPIRGFWKKYRALTESFNL